MHRFIRCTIGRYASLALREPLNKSSVFPPIQLKCAELAKESGNHEAEEPGNEQRIRAVQQEDASSGVSGRDGAGGAVGGTVRPDRAGISEGRQRAAAGGSGADAAGLLFATVVQPVGPGGGRGAV